MTSLIKASKSPSEMRDIASRICREYLSGAWKTISAEDIQLRRISGGLSNFLFYVSLPDNNQPKDNESTILPIKKRPRKDSYPSVLEPKEVLLRIYGQTHGEQAVESILTDSVVFALLSERKLGPKLHGIFPGGRIEQYIPARALLTGELADPKISSKIAEKMAQIHCLDIPVSKEPDWIWNTSNRWLQIVEKILTNCKTKTEKEAKNAEYLKKINFREELKWLQNVVENEDFPIIFSHNDLQEGNVLFREDFSSNSSLDKFSSAVEDFDESASSLNSHLNSILLSPDRKNNEIEENGNTIYNQNLRKRSFNENSNDSDLETTRDSLLSGDTFTEPELMIIDFEYCAYNYRGFDFANHFLEWTFDYTNKEEPFFYHKLEQYPNKEQMENFISSYLTQFNENSSPTADEVNEIVDEIKSFTLVSHLFWSLWAIVNVHHEDIEFGYWEYANCRTKQYFIEKEKFIKENDLRYKKKRNDY